MRRDSSNLHFIVYFVSQMIDGEINNLLNESYKRAMNILVTHKKELHLLAGEISRSQFCNKC